MVTGGAGFIGSNFVLDYLAHNNEPIVNLDKLTYAGNIENLASVADDNRHRFVQADIGDGALVERMLNEHQPRAVLHFAAESHVDRSIAGPHDFIQTNIVGTCNLLEATRGYWSQLPATQQQAFRFLHISTDEVYGSLAADDAAFTETNRHIPNSPYAASKAASDHLVRAWHRTYGLPVVTTHCSNNYGPYQGLEKLVPLTITNALAGRPLPIYGDGKQVRDWLHVTDHCQAVSRTLEAGQPGQTYNIGGDSEQTNIAVVQTICQHLDALRPRADGDSYSDLITHVKDRAGHDRRYAINADKIQRELSWRPAQTFASGIRQTIQWYLDHSAWVERAQNGSYRDWLKKQYGVSV